MDLDPIGRVKLDPEILFMGCVNQVLGPTSIPIYSHNVYTKAIGVKNFAQGPSPIDLWWLTIRHNK